MAGIESRSYPRFPVHVPVTAEWPPNVIEMEVVNISRAGLLMTGAELLPVGLQLTLRFILTTQIELKGVVRHAISGCGVEFIALPPEEQAKLHAYLDRLAAMVVGSLKQELGS